jgi:2',3'-cyclic-nucleotide 2'-phosphodiesterase (5'-nucleotidase family)
MKDEAGKPVEGLAPFSLRSFASLKLALIGLTAPIDVYRVFFNLIVEKPESVLPELLAGARAQGAKTILVLSHLGSPADQSLAKEIGGIDVIIGAHDHKELDPPLVVNHTIIAQAGDFGRFLGRLDLKIDPNTGRILEHAGRLIPVGEDAPLDPETQQAMQAEQQRAQQTMSREIGILNSPIKLCDDEECAAGNLLADALLERLEGAELCLVLPGHWESGLEAGILTQGTLFAANRSTANPARVELTGRQIEQFLHEALKPENAARQLHALRGRAVGLPHVAGARVTYSDDLEQIDIQIRGKTLEKDRKYVVASTDMEFSDFVNYLVIPFKLIEFEVPTIMPEVLQDYIARHSPIQAPETGRILLKAK